MKGDGLEKREENFAEEIAKQINGKDFRKDFKIN